jgi:hypothetical protein
MRQTNEQRAATDQLRQLAGPYRVTQDIEGWPVIEGRLGQIEFHDGLDLAVYTDRRLVRGRLLALDGVRRHQTGDDEVRALFPPAILPAVAKAIRARRRRVQSSARSIANLRSRAALADSAASGPARPSDGAVAARQA